MKSLTKTKGVTLLELLIAIAMVGILASLAVPAFQETIARNKVTSTANSLVGAFNYARAEAVDRQQQVAVREKTGGWEVVADPSGAAEVIREFQLTSNSVAITTTLSGVVYEASGFTKYGSKNKLVITDNDTSTSRTVCVSVSGSVKVIKSGSCP